MSSVHLELDGVTIQGADLNDQEIRDGLSLAPASSRFETTLQLINVSLWLRRTTSISLRSLLGNATTMTTAASASQQARWRSHNMVFVSEPIILTIPSCSSNLWDGAPMTCANVLRPVDGQRRVNWSLVRIEVDDHQDDWCATCCGASLTPLFVTRSLLAQPHAQHSTTLAGVSSAVTAAVLALAMLTSSTGVASAVPRLQGMVGTLRLAARCVATSSDSGDDSSSSNYAGTDISDNPLFLHLPVAPSLSYAAGALLGNTLLVAGVAVVSHTMSLLRKWVNRNMIDTNSFVSQFSTLDLKPQSSLSWYQMRLRTFAALCCSVLPTTPLPASLQCQQGFLLQPVAAAAMVCLLSSDRGPLSVLLAIIIGVAWIAVPCTFMWVLCVKYSPLPLTTIATRSADTMHFRWVRGGRMLEWLCTEREEWVATGHGRAAKATSRYVKLRLSAVFESYRGGRHWYFGVDALQSVLTGVAVGAAESVTAADVCTAAVWGTACVGAIAAVSAVLCIVLQPHVVRFELLAAVAVSLLAVLAAVLILADDANASGVVSLVASVAELLPLVAALVWKCCHVHRSTTPHLNVDQSESVSSRGRRSIACDQRSVCDQSRRRLVVSGLRCKTTTRQPTEAMIQQDEVLKALLECICRK
ncbi:transmembrane protein, putative [Bodo saltans]|uniref:Transmembrane protein, putative n=1 Tax=Bodo saltans TaxID=75058 RepID=A0A0S4JE05_BODSA|nr:transmembrane protein, putative [Bodo saltans]|eukprot:CUG88349.1 transmembrane protein, putative [Bodo saltans]